MQQCSVAPSVAALKEVRLGGVHACMPVRTQDWGYAVRAGLDMWMFSMKTALFWDVHRTCHNSCPCCVALHVWQLFMNVRAGVAESDGQGAHGKATAILLDCSPKKPILL